MNRALAPHTLEIFEKVSRLDCIKPYVLVGGTALSLQLGTRQSEDLDFMSWRTSRSERREVDWPEIERELTSIGVIRNMDILDINHVEFIVCGVKISFYATDSYAPKMDVIPCLNNLRLAGIRAIGAMKMEVMLRRSVYRDYYDIYSILKSGERFSDMMEIALKYSGHRLKSKHLMAMLSNGSRFRRDDEFKELAPVYDITSEEIEMYIKDVIMKERQNG